MIQGAELSRQANQSMQNMLENTRIRGEVSAAAKADLLKSKVPVKAPPKGPPAQTTRESSQREEVSAKAEISIGGTPIKAPPPQLSPQEQREKEERRKQEGSAKERAPSRWTKDEAKTSYADITAKFSSKTKDDVHAEVLQARRKADAERSKPTKINQLPIPRDNQPLGKYRVIPSNSFHKQWMKRVYHDHYDQKRNTTNRVYYEETPPKEQLLWLTLPFTTWSNDEDQKASKKASQLQAGTATPSTQAPGPGREGSKQRPQRPQNIFSSFAKTYR